MPQMKGVVRQKVGCQDQHHANSGATKPGLFHAGLFIASLSLFLLDNRTYSIIFRHSRAVFPALPSEGNMPLLAGVYRPRRPQDLDYYRCVKDYFENFVRVYAKYCSRLYGFWRPYLEKVIYRYLYCGDLHNGFARVKSNDCGHEYLLAFSCKRRHFCPSCHQEHVVEFGEWVCIRPLT